MVSSAWKWGPRPTRRGGYRVQVRVFHGGTPVDLARQVNGFLAELPAAYVRALQTAAVAATIDEEPGWEYAALIEYEVG